MSTIFKEHPTWYALLNPIADSFGFGQKDAFRFIEPVNGLDSKAGAIEYQSTGVRWATLNENGLVLNMTGDQFEWQNTIKLSIKKNEYRKYKTTYFTMENLLIAFGSVFAIVNKSINFSSKSFIENDV